MVPGGSGKSYESRDLWKVHGGHRVFPMLFFLAFLPRVCVCVCVRVCACLFVRLLLLRINFFFVNLIKSGKWRRKYRSCIHSCSFMYMSAICPWSNVFNLTYVKKLRYLYYIYILHRNLFSDNNHVAKKIIYESSCQIKLNFTDNSWWTMLAIFLILVC